MVSILGCYLAISDRSGGGGGASRRIDDVSRKMNILPICYTWLRRGLHKILRGIRGAGGGGGASGLLTTFVSITIFFVFYFSFYSSYRGYVERETVDGANDFDETDKPNRTWIHQRKLLLQKNVSVTKVVVLSYMRGGSTLFSEIFNQEPSTDVLWHEPMDAFYQSYAGFEAHSIPLTILYYKNNTRRLLSDSEKDEITNYLENLLSCRPENLPIETLSHFHISYSSAFKPVYSCMEAKKAKAMMVNCKKPLRPVCGFTDLIRRDMSVTVENKCPQLIAAFKSMKHLGRFLVQRLLFDVAASKTGAVAMNNASAVLLASHLKENKNSEMTDGVITESTVDMESVEKTRNAQLLAEHQLCLSQVRPMLRNCSRPALDVCGRARLTALKLIRMMLEDLEGTIRRIPDIHVIYYVRDPRAIATSRAEDTTRLTMEAHLRSAVNESRILCRRMMEDVRAKRRLEVKYPGSVVTVKYEDFVRDPLSHVKEIFERIGRPVPPNIGEWIRTKFRGTEDNGIYGTVRANPVLTSRNWMTAVTLRDALRMDEYCQDVLKEFGYTPIHEMRASDESDDEAEAAAASSPANLTSNKN